MTSFSLPQVIKKSKMSEMEQGIDYNSAEEDFSDSESSADLEKEEEVAVKETKVMKKQQWKNERSARRVTDDTSANAIYQAQNPFYSFFSAKK